MASKKSSSGGSQSSPTFITWYFGEFKVSLTQAVEVRLAAVEQLACHFLGGEGWLRRAIMSQVTLSPSPLFGASAKPVSKPVRAASTAAWIAASTVVGSWRSTMSTTRLDPLGQMRCFLEPCADQCFDCATQHRFDE